MNADVLDWLPKEAFTRDAVNTALSGLLESWSSSWFAPSVVLAWDVATVQGRKANQATAQSLEIRGNCAGLELSGYAKRQLLEAALDVELSGETLLEGDHRLLDAFIVRVAEDLLAKLDKAFGGVQASNGDTQLRLTARIAGKEVLSLHFPAALVVSLLKTKISKSKPPGAALRNRLAALGPTKFTAEGVLGNVELSVSDLKELSVGDVLILDRALNEAVELRVGGNGKQIGRGKLRPQGERISIQF